MIYILVLAIGFLSAFANYWTTWTFSLFFICAFLCTEVSKKIHWSVGLCAFHALTTSLFLLIHYYPKYQQLDANIQMSFEHLTTLSFISLFSIVALAPNMNTRACGRALAYAGVLDSGWTIFRFLFGMNGNIFGNPSMNGCFMVMSLPFIFNYLDKRYLIPVCLGILSTEATVPFVGAYAVLVILFARNIRDAIASLVIPCGFLIAIDDFSNSTGRFPVWKESLKWWWNNGDIYQGMGNGTFFMWGPHIQQHTQTNVGNWFVWMHNDYLQVLFEQGIIGLVLVFIMCFYLLKQAFDRRYLLAGLIGYLIMAFFNFMVHLPVHAAIGALLVVSIFQGRENQNGSETFREVIKKLYQG